MKNFKLIFSLLLTAMIIGCSGDESGLENVDGIGAPENLSALFTITQDNTGLVTIRPNGTGVTSYEVHFGDDTTTPGVIGPGETIDHNYDEGVYTVKIIASTLNGKTTEFTKELTVTFVPPIDLEVTATAGANKSVTVSAKAKYETFFQVFFGDDPNAAPVEFMEGDVVTHTYGDVGTYTIKVIALSGGVATTEATTQVTILGVTPSPTPTIAAANVISLFSDAYTNVPVDTWKTDWSSTAYEQVNIDGNAAKKYSNLTFVGIETVAQQIDATQMTHFHTDVWSADFTEFRVKLVDFGPNAAFGGGDDKEHEIIIANPAKEQWVSIDIPLSQFTGLTTRAHISQLIYVGAPAGNTTVYVDNVFFYKQPTGSITSAPTPTHPASNVISMFSDSYTNVAMSTWKTSWSAATLEDVTVEGNPTKKYSSLDFVGAEPVAQINATGMTHFHVDVWSADFTLFRIKLVDFGPNGIYQGGDDKEHEIVFTAPAKNTWLSLDIPLSDFTNLTTRANLQQFIFSAQPTGGATVYIDNVYFHN